MAYYWFRGHTSNEGEGSAVGLNQWMKLAYFFLKYSCGWTDESQYVQGSDQSYIGNATGSEIITGSDGEFLASTWSFQDTIATNPFIAGTHEGDYLCVVDSTNKVNSSVFPIKKVYSTSKVDIDFKADFDNAEYPTAASGLTWYVIPKNYELPNTVGDWWRLQSPHATNWALKVAHKETSRVGIQVAVDGNWTGSKLIGGGSDTTDGSFYLTSYGNNRFHIFDMIVESTGKLLFIGVWSGYMNSGHLDHYQNLIVNEITPTETMEAYEEIALLAPAVAHETVPFRDNADSKFGLFRTWNEEVQQPSTGYMIEYTTSESGINSENSPLASNPFRPIGNRDATPGQRVGKLINYSGDVLVADVESAARDFRVVGYTSEYRVCSALHTGYGCRVDYVGEQRWRGPMALTVSSARDWLYHSNGLCLPWCGLTYKAFG
jgi:hypothetical protein